MNKLKTLFVILWRIWFYFLVLFVVILLSPLLLITLSKEQWYPYFFKVARVWAYTIFYGMGFRLKVHDYQLLDAKKSYMLIANHTSMIDIMLMLIVAKTPFVFVGKAELGKIPIFGYFYKKACILVDRSSAESRKNTIEQAQKKLANGRSICIFPEGGVPDDTSILLDTFKEGAFRLAIEFQIPIVAYTFVGLKEAFPFDFFKGYPTKIEVYQHPIIPTHGMSLADKKILKEQARNMIASKLS